MPNPLQNPLHLLLELDAGSLALLSMLVPVVVLVLGLIWLIFQFVMGWRGSNA